MKEVWASDCTDERAWRNVQNFPDTTRFPHARVASSW
jgi:hypothetical protein